jgi:circadian clock protein KaiB
MAGPVASRKADGAAKNLYLLRLYVTGSTQKSLRAVANLSRLCERHLAGRYKLDVVDLYQQPALAAQQHLVAAPTLVKELPPPERRLVGDMSNSERVLERLGLREGSAVDAK